MRLLSKFSLNALVLLSGSAYALDPVQGFYAGLMGTGSYPNSIHFSGPGIDISTTPPSATTSTVSGKLNYSIGGGGGGQIGYRYDQFRFEVEGLYNYSPYDSLTLNGVKFAKHKNAPTPLANGYTFSGNTQFGAAMVNGFYDMYMGTDCDYVPYVGIGVGYTYLWNNLNLYYNDVEVAGGVYSDHDSLFSAQAIGGLSYFFDDYTSVGLDFRYFFTQSANLQLSKVDRSSFRFNVYTLNLAINVAFDC